MHYSRAALMVLAAPGLLLQLVDPQRRLGLRQLRVELFASLFGERLEIARLGPGHRLVAGHPVMRILLGVRRHRLLVRLVLDLVCHVGVNAAGPVSFTADRAAAAKY